MDISALDEHMIFRGWEFFMQSFCGDVAGYFQSGEVPPICEEAEGGEQAE